MLGVHRDLQAERTRLDDGWQHLEQERQGIARQRRNESALVAVAQLAGGLAVVLAVVGFCWVVLVGLRTSNSESDLNELLIREISSDESLLFPTSSQQPRLSKVDESISSKGPN